MSDTRRQGGAHGRFAATIATSTAIMYGPMYLNAHALDHVSFGRTRLWTALRTGAVMARGDARAGTPRTAEGG